MALDVPGGLFEQSDVRETASDITNVTPGATETKFWSCSSILFILGLFLYEPLDK